MTPLLFVTVILLAIPAFTQASTTNATTATTTNVDLTEVPFEQLLNMEVTILDINDAAAWRAGLRISSKLMQLRKKPAA